MLEVVELDNSEVNQLKIDLNLTFNSDHGRRVLNALMEFGHVLEPPALSTDPMEIMFKSGRRDILMFILYHMDVSSEDFPNIISQSLSNENTAH
jgi:hypothetical protein